jgi:hypothetical protein
MRHLVPMRLLDQIAHSPCWYRLRLLNREQHPLHRLGKWCPSSTVHLLSRSGQAVRLDAPRVQRDRSGYSEWFVLSLDPFNRFAIFVY